MWMRWPMRLWYEFDAGRGLKSPFLYTAARARTKGNQGLYYSSLFLWADHADKYSTNPQSWPKTEIHNARLTRKGGSEYSKI